MNVAVLVPCFNEELTIKKVIRDFQVELPEAKIYVYDNNSTDQTGKFAREAGAEVVVEPRQGKGNVVYKMFLQIEADIYIMVDGDDTYPASEIHKVMKPVLEGLSDMSIGDRITNGTYTKENKRRFHCIGNYLVRTLINHIFRAKLKDIMTGYRVFNRFFVKNIPIISEGFEVETEMTIQALHKKFSITEIPIHYRDRPEGSQSKLSTYRDGFNVLKLIFMVFKNYRPLTFFSIISTVLFIAGFGIGTPVIIEFFESGLVPKLPRAVLATGCILLSAISFTSGLILDTIARHNLEAYSWMLKNHVK